MFGLGRGGIGLGGVAGGTGRRGAILFADLFLLEAATLAVEIGCRCLGIALAATFALEVGIGLAQPGFGLLLGLCHALGFGSQCIVRHAQTLKGSGGSSFVVAQRRQRGRGFGLCRVASQPDA